MSELEGRVVVITGGAGVLCSAMARDLAARGARVALLGRTGAKVEALAEEIKASGGDALGVECNVLDVESVKKAHEEVLRVYGKCSVLINGAGGNSPEACTTKETYSEGDIENSDTVSFFDLTKKGFDSVFGLNLTGTVLPTQEFARDMLGCGGNILNISSMSAYAPMTKVPAYSAAKAGISNLTNWLAVHFAEEGIRVNAIAPGFFLTEQNRTLMTNPDGSPTERAKKVIYKTPMNRFGKPEELLGAVRFLIDDDEAGFITGITMPIDGGFMAYSGV